MFSNFHFYKENLSFFKNRSTQITQKQQIGGKWEQIGGKI